MKLNIRRILPWLLVCLVMMMAVEPMDARRKRSKSTKAKTTAVSKSKKSKKSKKSSKKSRSKSSGSYASKAKREDATMLEIPAVAPTPTRKVVDERRRIKVDKPDLDQIRETTLDPHSKFYFPKLKAKYEVNDTTMTPEEFRNFYLGYMFQEDFDPYRVSPYSGVTDNLRLKATHTKEEIDTITKYALLSLEDNPFDLRQMSFLVHVLKEKRKDMRAKIWEYRLENLLGAIKSTGTGENLENAWYVIYPVHEYDMVQLLGYEATDAEFIEPGYDYLTVRPDEADTRKRDKSAKGFYFNVMVPQEQYELKHPEDVAEQPEVNAFQEELLQEKQNEGNLDDLPAE